MINNKKTKLAVSKKIILSLIIILTPIILIALFIIGSLAISPIFNYFEGQKFVLLNQESKLIFNTINKDSNKSDNWKYGTGCGMNHAGDFPDGTFRCVSISYMEKPVTSVEELQKLHEKYFAVFENSDQLSPLSEIEYIYGDTFGKKFVVSYASKNYIENKSGLECEYIAYLGQETPNLAKFSDDLGSEIISSKGQVSVILECGANAHQPWYDLIKDTDSMIPDFTPSYDYDKNGWF